MKFLSVLVFSVVLALPLLAEEPKKTEESKSVSGEEFVEGLEGWKEFRKEVLQKFPKLDEAIHQQLKKVRISVVDGEVKDPYKKFRGHRSDLSAFVRDGNELQISAQDLKRLGRRAPWPLFASLLIPIASKVSEVDRTARSAGLVDGLERTQPMIVRFWTTTGTGLTTHSWFPNLCRSLRRRKLGGTL